MNPSSGSSGREDDSSSGETVHDPLFARSRSSPAGAQAGSHRRRRAGRSCSCFVQPSCDASCMNRPGGWDGLSRPYTSEAASLSLRLQLVGVEAFSMATQRLLVCVLEASSV